MRCLTESVRMRLISEVPLGAFLSGGIDSSTVVAYMAKTSDSPVLASSVGFADAAFNELGQARRIADHLGCTLDTKLIAPDVEDLLPRLAWHFDEPFGDSSAVPTYCVSAAARERVTVALSGDGGDELWAGYPWHRVEWWESQVREPPRVGAAATWRRGSGICCRSRRRAPDRFAILACRRITRARASTATSSSTTPPSDDALLRRSRAGDPRCRIRSRLSGARTRLVRSADPLDRSMYVDVKTYLADDILTKVDKMSMAVSLEARVPLLDHKLIEFAARVPSSLKLRRGRSKHLLRQVLERRVPRSIFDGPKHGFTAPIAEWLRGPLKGMATELLLDGRLKDRGHLPLSDRCPTLERASTGASRSPPSAVVARHARAVVPAVRRRRATAPQAA